MELWIRSQDKRILELFNNVEATDNPSLPYEKIVKNKWYIEAYGSDLGHYDSKKRALEIIDEIQNILINSEDSKIVIYEMPKE